MPLRAIEWRFEMMTYKSNESEKAIVGNQLLPLWGGLRGAESAENDALLRAQFVHTVPA